MDEVDEEIYMNKIIHDGDIKRYEVDFEKEELKLFFNIESPYVPELRKNNKKAVIIFSGLLTHAFKYEHHQNILSDIYKYDIETFIKENKELLRESRNYCWPLFFDDFDDLKTKLLKQKCNYYVIESSNGLDRWVLAKDMTIKY